MKIGRFTRSISCEFTMQAKFKEWVQQENHRISQFNCGDIGEIILVDEFFVKEVGRRADFLLIKEGKLINIEAKCNDLRYMLDQIKDHATYCDYSYAFIPDYTLTPRDVKYNLIAMKYGLFIYNYEHEIITEVFEAHNNKNINKALRDRVIKKIKAIDSKKRAIQGCVQTQIELT